MLRELTPEQIGAIFAGLALVIGAIAAAAKRSAKAQADSVAGGDLGALTPNALLALDLNQTKNLQDAIVALAKTVADNTLALNSNTDECKKVRESVDDTGDRIHAMTMELVRTQAAGRR